MGRTAHRRTRQRTAHRRGELQTSPSGGVAGGLVSWPTRSGQGGGCTLAMKPPSFPQIIPRYKRTINMSHVFCNKNSIQTFYLDSYPSLFHGETEEQRSTGSERFPSVERRPGNIGAASDPPVRTGVGDTAKGGPWHPGHARTWPA